MNIVSRFFAGFSPSTVYSNWAKVPFSHRFLALVFFFICSVCLNNSDGASFFGESYMKVPLQQDTKNIEFEFRFKTHQLNAFFFLAAGTSDYCLLFLENGQLAVKINFGSGETYLASDGLQLNDLSWHKVKLKLVNTHLSLNVNEKHNYLHRIKGDSHELHIQYGIFLGGQDNFKSLYLGNIPPLRGCLDGVQFNHRDIIQAAAQNGISWNVGPDCDEQFNLPMGPGSGQNNTFSFTEDDSFVLFPGFASSFSQNANKVSFSFEIKTISSNAVILFSPSVSPYKRRYIAIELVDGKVKFAINDGTEGNLQSAVNINDGHWHSVECVAGKGQLQVTIDGQVSRTSRSSKEWSFSRQHYSSEMLIGGLSSKTDWTGLLSVMLSQNVSLKGCLRNVHINGRFASLQNATATHRIQTGKCKWNFLCGDAAKSPCIESAECLQITPGQVKCTCHSGECARAHFKHKSIRVISEKAHSPCRRILARLQVIEGSIATIGREIFGNALSDVSKGTTMTVLRQPKHGSLDSANGTNLRGSDGATFSWFKLQNSPLLYKHDGSEQNSDQIEIRLEADQELVASREINDNCKEKLLILPIDIVSGANDAPNTVPNVKLFQVANTGLVMAHNTVAFIHSSNLSFSIGNETDQSQLIKYEIVAGPRYGILQKLRTSSNLWRNATYFTQRQVDRSKVRYVHLTGRPKQDKVGLRVSINKEQVSRKVSLGIIFVNELRIVASGPNRIPLSGQEKEVIIDGKALSYRTEPVRTTAGEVLLTFLSVPLCGGLYLAGEKDNQGQLHITSAITQRDINEGKFLYVKNSSPLCDDANVDSFDFEVAIAGSKITQVATFFFDIGQTSRRNELTNSKLTVGEGENATIEASHLYYTSHDEDGVTFNIIRQPQNGYLLLDHKKIRNSLPSQFAQRYLKEGRLVYVHDDSETETDTFEFVVSNKTHSNITSGKFFIEVTMKNDNPPTRQVEKPFNVIRYGEKPLLGSDFRYLDADMNTSAGSITYTNTYIPNGQLFFLNGTSANSGFTQADLDQGHILFRHNGSDLAKAEIWVSDGQFYLSGAMEIRASDPYIRVINNTGIVVKYGTNRLITASNLAIESNLDLSNKSSIIFKIIAEPRLGVILVAETEATQFTMEELEDELVQYESTVFDEPPVSKMDNFSFRVLTGDEQTSAGLIPETHQFAIRIYPQSYYNLQLRHIENLTVLEDKSAVINSEHLLAEHPLLKAEQIVYRVLEGPSYGHLSNSKYTDLSEMARRDGQGITFSQADINAGYLVYRQDIKCDLDPYSRFWDSFSFSFSFIEIGNEVINVGNKTLFVEIVPKLIALSTSNLTVSEGQAVILSPENLAVSHPFYEQLINDFIIVEIPKHGTVWFRSPSGVPLTSKSFTPAQLKDGRISYLQNSEATNDWLTIVARTSLDQESLPGTVHISISSVNDETPRVVTNSDAWVWRGGTVLIGSTNLATVDDDNNAGEIVYTTYQSSNGYLIDSTSNTTIETFTQEAIDLGRVYFVHVGTGDGSFHFHVSSHEHSGHGSHVFRVRVKQRTMIFVAKEKLLVTPGMVQSITRQHLLVLSSDNDTERQYRYRVVKAPSYGRIVIEGVKDRSQLVNSFTQKDIDENQVLYEQSGHITEPVVCDRIVFNVESEDLPPLESVHFLVEIAVPSLRGVIEGSIEEVVRISTLVVREGHLAAIGPRELNLTHLFWEAPSNEQLCLVVLTFPKHGLVLRGGKSVKKQECTPMEASRNGSLVYMHDNSDTLLDSVAFQLMLVGGVTISLLNFTLPIDITPVNDEYPVVVNRNPIANAIFGTKTAITNETFMAYDKDGPTFSLIYQIRKDANISSRESHFTMQRAENDGDFPVFEFTQRDIDLGHVFFKHKGHELYFIYWFRVKDEELAVCDDETVMENNFEAIVSAANVPRHCTPYYPLKVAISHKLSLQLVKHTAIQVPQGTFREIITREHLSTASRNASPNFIRYKITQGPFHGYISVEGEPSGTTEFSQQMIDNQLVSYNVRNFSSEDYFIVDIVQPESSLTLYEKPILDVNVKVKTKPMVKAMRPYLVASPGQQAQLSYEYLDASELALRTNSNPIFKIVTQPRYGHFKVLQFGESQDLEKDGEGVKEFSHEEIIRNRIVYLAKTNLDLSYPNEMLIDVIDYQLSAPKVQDAHGVLVVNVFRNRSTYVDIETLVSAEDYMQRLSLGLSSQLLLILATILICLVLVICLVAILRINSCKKNSHRESTNSSKSLSPSDDLHRCDRQYSRTSLRQTECSSRTSSNSALAACLVQPPSQQEQPLRYQLPPLSSPNMSNSQPSSRPLPVETERSDLVSPMPYAPRSVKSDDISPLPPPSLYFINDSSFDEPSLWNKAALRLEMQERPHHYGDSNEQANRSNADGTSNANSQAATVQVTCKGKPYEQFVHIDNYLANKSSRLASEQAFYTLNTRRSQDKLKLPQTQSNNQYWI